MLSRKWHDWRPIRAGNRIAMTVLGPQPAPLCRFKGVRGEIEIPPRFSLGGRGDILFSKENIPLASPYRNGTVPPGTPVIFSARRKENGDSIRCGIAAHLRTNLVRLMSQKKMWGAFCAAKPRFLRRTVACLRIIPDQRHTHAPGTAPAPAQLGAGDGVDADARLL